MTPQDNTMTPQDYNATVEENAQRVFDVMERRVTPSELDMIKRAFALARKAHAPQVRKSGEPYILHPIAVASIVADEMELGAAPVAAAFLHDVVEDTEYTIEDIRDNFGDDVAFLVEVVTKKGGHDYEMSKQLDNYKQILNSLQFDIRAVLIKLADRLHNMRTLASMAPEKQMKIAGETDYFYAPLANRLGLYNIKTELENLSFKFRCPDEYLEICTLISDHVERNRSNLETFKQQIEETLAAAGIKGVVKVDFRRPFSLWRKMKKYGDDFNHLKYRHFVEVVFDDNQSEMTEKQMAMKIYCILTDRFREKHCSMSNYIDAPKENGYQSLHVKLMPDFGRWQEVHISSQRMIRQSQLGCVAGKGEDNLEQWIEKFRKVLKDTLVAGHRDFKYMEDIVSSFYNDDIQVFTNKGETIILPQGSTALDFAYEVNGDSANHARYARVNGRLYPIIGNLHRGDVVEIFDDADAKPDDDWEEHIHTYKGRKALRRYRQQQKHSPYIRCDKCNPIPGEEVIGIRNFLIPSEITVHKRDCREAIIKASSFGEDVVAVDFKPESELYPVELSVRCVDRHHLFMDMADCITNKLNLSMASFNTRTERSIVECRITFSVHSNEELRSIMQHISAIDGVDEVKRL